MAFDGITIIANNRSERGPLESVISALKGCRVVGLSPMQQKNSPAGTLAFGIWFFSQEFQANRPRLVIIVGDRYESLAAALAALYMKIPIAHIHGGEITLGAIDDATRGAISAVSDLHFAAYDAAYAYLCVTRGEDRVFLAGAPGLDGINEGSAQRDEPIILLTFHPETREVDNGVKKCHGMIEALRPYANTHKIIWTGVNNDPGSLDIIRELTVCDLFEHRPELTRATYISLMQHAQFVIGNSSSGMIEAPWIGIPSVNIGYRQCGRPEADSVFTADHECDADEIGDAIMCALDFRGPACPPYRDGAAEKIAKTLVKLGFGTF